MLRVWEHVYIIRKPDYLISRYCRTESPPEVEAVEIVHTSWFVPGLVTCLVLFVLWELLNSQLFGRMLMTLSWLTTTDPTARLRYIQAPTPDLAKLVERLRSPLLELVTAAGRVEFRARFSMSLGDQLSRVWRVRWIGNLPFRGPGYEVESVSYAQGVPVQTQKALYEGPKWASRAVIGQFAAIVADDEIIATLLSDNELQELFDTPELKQRYAELCRRAAEELMREHIAHLEAKGERPP